MRKSATFKHRTAPRQGASNDSRDLLEEAETEQDEEPVPIFDLD